MVGLPDWDKGVDLNSFPSFTIQDGRPIYGHIIQADGWLLYIAPSDLTLYVNNQEVSDTYSGDMHPNHTRGEDSIFIPVAKGDVVSAGGQAGRPLVFKFYPLK